MKILWKYLTKSFLHVFYLALGGFVTIYVVIDLFEKIDNLVEAHVKAFNIFLYFLCRIPIIVVEGIPMGILIAAIISLGILGKNNEIVALKASGINLLRCIFPILTVALILSGVDFFFNQTLVPFCMKKANTIWQKKSKKGGQSAAVAQGRIWCRSENVILNADYFDKRNNLLKKVTLFVFDSEFDLIRRLDAREARWSGEDWIFVKGLDQWKNSENNWVITTFNARILPIEVNPVSFETVERLPDEMTYLELYNYVNRLEKEGYDTTYYRLKLHAKISFPATGIILGLLGISIAFLLGQHSSIPLGVALATALAFVYLVIFQFSISLGETGVLPPLIAAWIGNVLFSMVGCLLLLRAPL
ncbi:MAG: LPS export ABC transporter permease LptG [Deltaproteobacteria bacterium]|nr:MAG: LPS export ABC transporter permease LptG [Deltaproteobacteria bacterium]